MSSGAGPTPPFIGSREDAFVYLTNSTSNGFDVVSGVAVHIMDFKIRQALSVQRQKNPLQGQKSMNQQIDDYCRSFYDVDTLDEFRKDANRYLQQFAEQFAERALFGKIERVIEDRLPSQRLWRRMWTAAWAGLTGNAFTILLGFLIALAFSLYSFYNDPNPTSRVVS